MRIVYMGGPAISVPPLQALAGAGHEIVMSVCQPPRPSSRRGLRPADSPLKTASGMLSIPVSQPESVSSESFTARLRALEADCFIVFAYGQMLSPEVTAIPSGACVNIHASLLPRLRGAAPIARCIMNGDGEGGVSLMLMSERLDAGRVLAREAYPFPSGEVMTAGKLAEALASVASRMITAFAGDPSSHLARAQEQDESQATWAAKITKAERQADFSDSCERVCRLINALDPLPAAWAVLEGKRIQLFGARPVHGQAPGVPGTVTLSGGQVLVTCGDGAACVGSVKLEGKAETPAGAFFASRTGSVLTAGGREAP